jgi:pimeloyl-ACP methyl ester carboxylesterase
MEHELTSTGGWTRHDLETTVGRLAVWERGEGDVVVMRHGIFFDHTLWMPQADALARTHRVVLVDAPGHGASGDRGAPYTLQDDARATLEVMDALGVRTATLVGHSWGGMSAVRAALLDPDRVTALVLVDTPLEPSSALGRLRYAALRTMVLAFGAPRWFSAQVAKAMFSDTSRRRDPRLTADLQQALLGVSRRHLARAMTAVLVRPDSVLDRLGELTQPITLIVGDEDYVLPESTKRALAQATPHATVHTVAAKHVVPLEQPAEATALLEAIVGRALV